MSYLTDEQRSWARWIGGQKCELILKAALNAQQTNIMTNQKANPLYFQADHRIVLTFQINYSNV